MGTYIRLVDINDAKGKESAFLSAVQDKNSSIRFETSAENFSKIPGSPVAYWMGDAFISLFEGNDINDIAEPRMGLTTGQNEKYLRLWYEISFVSVGLNMNRDEAKKSCLKWFPYNKGGEYRKWYGNRDYVVNWYNDGYEMQHTFHPDGKRIWAHNFNQEYNFIEHISWNDLSTNSLSFRFFNKGFLFDSSAAVAFVNAENKFTILGYLNTKIVNYIAKLLNPTMHFKLNDFARLPFPEINNNKIQLLAENNIIICKSEWDSFETSWDFTTHPFITHKSNGYIETSFKNWEEFAERQFYQLKANEEELNRIFIDIYGLQDELKPEVEEKDVTVRKADLGRDVRSFISYAFGCMLGRYSLDIEGLAYAGGNWDQSKYKTYIPDADNCIPITDEEYFDDDVVSRFVDFVKTVYGKDTLEKNLEFIAEALGNRGDTPLKTIRNYFINDFYKDHVKIYQKRPIYWLFDSGKENGFKALIYMHRYNADTIGNMRIEYIHKLQAKYESQLSFEQHLIDTSQNQREKSAAMKQKEKLIRQIKEIKDYDVKIAHLANCRIEIDLDDGVKVNYEKVQTGKDGKKLEVLGKI